MRNQSIWGLFHNKIQLPAGVAFWVLAAHLYALLTPLVLLLVIQQQAEQILLLTDYPQAFYISVIFMMIGSAFEIAQNHLDRWYLTPETPSAMGVGTCDMLFYFFIVSGQAALIIACMGKMLWLSVSVVLLALTHPLFYRYRKGSSLPLTILGFLSTAIAFKTFGDPVILLQIGLPLITMFFFNLLLKTRNQFFHAVTTLTASSGVLLLAWGIYRAGNLSLDGWLVSSALVIVAVIVTLGLRRFLESLPQTPRPEL